MRRRLPSVVICVFVFNAGFWIWLWSFVLDLRRMGCFRRCFVNSRTLTWRTGPLACTSGASAAGNGHGSSSSRSSSSEVLGRSVKLI